MKQIKIFLFGIIVIFIFSFLNPKYFLPVDELNYLPSFSLDTWQRPHNSLLADPIYQFEPWRFFAKKEILKGKFPIWNPDNASGIPFFANPQTAVLFPLNFFYYIFSPKIASWIIPLLKLYLFFWFTFWYLKNLKVKNSAAILGSTAATFSGFMLTWLLWPQTNVFIFFPLFLLLVEKMYQLKKSTHRLLLGVSITTCLAWFGGHPETFIHIVSIASIYALVRLWSQKNKLISFYFFIFLGLLLSFIQIIPFLEYVFNSSAFVFRQKTPVSGYLPLQSFVFNFIPFLLGAPQKMFYRSIASYTNFQEIIGGYVGPGVFLTALWGMFKLKKNSIVYFWMIAIIACFAISYNIFPFSLFNQLPFIRLLANYRLIAVAGFGISVIFAISINSLYE